MTNEFKIMTPEEHTAADLLRAYALIVRASKVGYRHHLTIAHHPFRYDEGGTVVINDPEEPDCSLGLELIKERIDKFEGLKRKKEKPDVSQRTEDRAAADFERHAHG